MKFIFLISSIVISMSCPNSTQDQTTQDNETHPTESQSMLVGQNPDSIKWINSFREFATAILNNDRETVKSFIDFPIRNEGNEIWYLADSRLVTEIAPGKVVPFTETDLDKYYSSIISIDFKNTLQKLNLDELVLKGKTSTPEIEVIKDSKSKLVASHDKTKQKLILDLFTFINGRKNSEFIISYEFDILKDKKIKFRQVHVAE